MRRARLIACGASIGVTIILLIILFTPLVPSTATRLAVDWYDGDADAVVILAGTTLTFGSQTVLGEDSYLRTIYGCLRIASRPAKYVITSGAGGAAEAMASLLRARCPGAFVIIEDGTSRSTRDSALRVQQIVRQLPDVSRVVVVTSDFHSFRASRAFRRAGLAVRTEPVPDIAKRSSSRLFRLQGFGALAVEMMKVVEYWFRGWM